ncbi:MAG: hypothetical protein NXI24_15625 [bacterium]|nr:hypothetical protein [bacterium]
MGFALLLACAACVPGGIVTKGGVSGQAAIYPAITRTRGADYDILCFDQTEAKRREALDEQERRSLGPPVRLTPAENYRGGCEVEGESSVFLLFNIWPATRPLDVEYAISTAVQRLEGDTMIRIHAWHETHYYSLLGRARVFKVRGDVIRYRADRSAGR